MIPVERLRAMIRLLSPDEMTPTAKRQLTLLCDEYDKPSLRECQGCGTVWHEKDPVNAEHHYDWCPL